MIDVVMQGGSIRRKRALKLWYKVLSEYQSGKTAELIAKENKRSRAWVYWVLRKFKNNEV